MLFAGDGPKLAAVATVSHAAVVDALVSSGVDFLIADMEHAPLTDGDVEAILIAAAPTPVFTRVRTNDARTIGRALDLGPAGIVIPMVDSPREASDAVAATRYPPEGVRGFGPRRAIRYGRYRAEYLAGQAWPQVIVQIEHAKAVDRLPEILQVVGIGAVMIGVNDLAASMGLLRDALSNDLVDTIERIAMTCRSQSMPFGLTASMRNVVLSRTGFSPDFLILGEDLVLMQAGFQNAISDVLGHEARC